MNKINVLGVIIKHYKTMSDQRGTMLMSDITVHFIVPLSLSFVRSVLDIRNNETGNCFRLR